MNHLSLLFFNFSNHKLCFLPEDPYKFLGLVLLPQKKLIPLLRTPNVAIGIRMLWKESKVWSKSQAL